VARAHKIKKRRRRRKTETKRKLREIKRQWALFQQSDVDTKALYEIPEYFLQRSTQKEKKFNFSLGWEIAFEYAVLECPFNFWQYEKSDCESITQPDASAEELFEYLIYVIPFNS
jgi:hypothetical protein